MNRNVILGNLDSVIGILENHKQSQMHLEDYQKCIHLLETVIHLLAEVEVDSLGFEWQCPKCGAEHYETTLEDKVYCIVCEWEFRISNIKNKEKHE